MFAAILRRGTRTIRQALAAPLHANAPLLHRGFSNVGSTSIYPRRSLTMASHNDSATAQPPAGPDAVAEANAPATEPAQSTGSKRPAEDDLDVQEDPVDNDGTATPGDAPLSKNQLRKLKRQKLWEEKKADKKLIRKEKRHAKQE
ncbi:hypothetical protein Micbo1qcDRAFT_165585, partial [Microdochium bolleyi]